MLGLKHSRYLPVILEKSDSRPLLFHPAYIEDWLTEQQFLESEKNIFSSPWSSKDDFFSLINQIHNSQNSRHNFDFFTAVLKDISLQTFSLPSTPNEMNFKKFLQAKLLGMSELFDPLWDTHNMGSARNALLSRLQYKGIGRTLPVNSFDHLMASGKLSIHDSVHSFIISQLALVSLPLGSLPVQAVFTDKETTSNGASLIRGADSIRVAQLSDDLTSEELTFLLSHLNSTFPNQKLDTVVRRIMAQYAAISFLGGEFTSSADNLLIDGRMLDEESWIWPNKIGEWRFVVSFQCDENLASESHIPWQKIHNFMSSFEITERAISRLLKGFSLFTPDVPTFQKSKSYFLDHLSSLFSINKDWRKSKVEEFWNKGATLSSMKPQELKTWFEWLMNNGFKAHLGKTKKPGNYLLEITSTNYSASEFRPYGYALKLEELHKQGLIQDNAFQINANIAALIAKKSHLLPSRPNDLTGKVEANQNKISTWWESEMDRLEALQGNIVGFNYLEDGKIKTSTKIPAINRPIEPISFNYSMEPNMIMEIAATKTLLGKD